MTYTVSSGTSLNSTIPYHTSANPLWQKMTFRWHRTSANLLWEKTKNWLSSFWHKPANKQTNKQSEKVNPVGEATGKVSNADNNLLQPLLTLELVRGSAGLQQ